jgi:hypothetical protein
VNKDGTGSREQTQKMHFLTRAAEEVLSKSSRGNVCKGGGAAVSKAEKPL